MGLKERFQTLGWLADEVGLPVNKAILLRKVGVQRFVRKVVFENLTPFYRAKALEDNPKLEAGDVVSLDFVVPKYRIVRSYYFGSDGYVWEYSKVKTFELDLEFTAYQRRMTNVLFIDYDSGAFLPMGGMVVLPSKSPELLRRLWSGKAVENFVAGAKGKFDLMWFLLGAVVGGLGGYVILQLVQGMA